MSMSIAESLDTKYLEVCKKVFGSWGTKSFQVKQSLPTDCFFMCHVLYGLLQGVLTEGEGHAVAANLYLRRQVPNVAQENLINLNVQMNQSQNNSQTKPTFCKSSILIWPVYIPLCSDITHAICQKCLCSSSSPKPVSLWMILILPVLNTKHLNFVSRTWNSVSQVI